LLIVIFEIRGEVKGLLSEMAALTQCGEGRLACSAKKNEEGNS
jgi:hypothetical protein